MSDFEPISEWPPRGELAAPLLDHPTMPHFCGKPCGTNVPGKVEPLCAHPGPHFHFASGANGEEPAPVKRSRTRGHDGEHAAFVFSISTPERWSA